VSKGLSNKTNLRARFSNSEFPEALISYPAFAHDTITICPDTDFTLIQNLQHPYVAVNRFPDQLHRGFGIAAVELLRSRKACFNGKSENIMLTGGKMTKALQIARSFHAAGHRVILVENHKFDWSSVF